jgi:putative sterol carrier protein
VRPGASATAKVTLRVSVPDFVRIGTGELDAATPLLNGRAVVKGDLALAARLPEMFGAPSPY